MKHKLKETIVASRIKDVRDLLALYQTKNALYCKTQYIWLTVIVRSIDGRNELRLWRERGAIVEKANKVEIYSDWRVCISWKKSIAGAHGDCRGQVGENLTQNICVEPGRF